MIPMDALYNSYGKFIKELLLKKVKESLGPLEEPEWQSGQGIRAGSGV